MEEQPPAEPGVGVVHSVHLVAGKMGRDRLLDWVPTVGPHFLTLAMLCGECHSDGPSDFPELVVPNFCLTPTTYLTGEWEEGGGRMQLETSWSWGIPTPHPNTPCPATY